MRRCDLHTHSNFSDGSCTPAEIIAEAQTRGVSAVALTDHNTAKGLSDFLLAGEGSGVECVAGVELTCEFKTREVHILALFLDESSYSVIEDITRAIAESKREKNIELVSALCRDGYNISYDEILRKYPKGNINRAHIASELVACGYVSSISEAFSGVLREGGEYYVPPQRPDAIEIIKKIDEICAVSVIAHPYLSLDEGELDEFLRLASHAGLDGMEVKYTKYDKATEEKAEERARAYDLLFSGGSDYHGSVKPGTVLGHGYGELFVPYEYYELLRTRAEEKKKRKFKI